MSYEVAVVGATGAVGKEMLSVLHRRSFPAKSVRAFASARSQGRELAVGPKTIRVEELTDDVFQGVQIALFSIDKELSRRYAPLAAKAGALVIDNSNAFRMDDAVPLVVPEVNPERVGDGSPIIANPNCSTILMVVALHPIYKLAGVRRVVASTYQAVSGAGQKAMEELLTQTRALLGHEPVKPENFPHQIGFNLIPRIGSVEEDGYTTEELKMRNETRKILGDPSIEVSTTCVRLPVVRAHSEALNIQTERKVTVEEVRNALENAPGLRVVDDPDQDRYPMPIDADGIDEVLVGRIREDRSQENGLDIFLSGDQILKGAALNAVQIAELAVEKGRV